LAYEAFCFSTSSSLFFGEEVAGDGHQQSEMPNYVDAATFGKRETWLHVFHSTLQMAQVGI
jgi:hypothetical protein